MSLDAIKIINAAEDQGEEMHREALQRARELVQQATIDAEDYQVQMMRKAQAEGEAQLKKASEETQGEIKKIEQDNIRICQEISNKAEGRLGEAVASIMGRIVKSDGHS